MPVAKLPVCLGLRSTGHRLWTISLHMITLLAQVRHVVLRRKALALLTHCVVGWMWAAVNKLIDAQKLPHLLLYGPPGTGKTSTITACAKRLYGDKWRSMTLEVSLLQRWGGGC